MYIILYDDIYSGYLRPEKDIQFTRYGNVFVDRKQAEEIAQRVESWGYQNVRVYELTEVYNVDNDYTE